MNCELETLQLLYSTESINNTTILNVWILSHSHLTTGNACVSFVLSYATNLSSLVLLDHLVNSSADTAEAIGKHDSAVAQIADWENHGQRNCSCEISAIIIVFGKINLSIKVNAIGH